MNIQYRKAIGPTASLLSLAGLLAACATDNVDLGGSESVGQSLEVGARCADSPIVEGDVFVATREELEALRGCEAIRGDFRLMVYEEAELSPLSSLREVSGAFILGELSRPIPDEILLDPIGHDLAAAFAAEEAEAARSAEIVEAGWLGSLHGLEQLESVGKLTLMGIAAPDLGALASLRSLSDHPLPNESGLLSIERAKNLTDLRGLEGVTGIRWLRLMFNPGLQSLAGIEPAPRFDSVSLQDNPRLTDLTALSSVESLGGLAITQSAMENLDALATVSTIDSITLVANPELTNINGLANLSYAPDIIVMSNPKLQSLPEFHNLSGPLERFMIVDNAALRSVPLNFPVFNARSPLDTRPRFDRPPPTRALERPEIESGSSWFEISDNPQLESLAFGGGVTSALVFEVNRNDGLSSIDLGPLRSLNVLSLFANATLSEVALGDIQTVNLISAVDNPSLAVAELRTVRTFETVTSGNADDTAE